MIEQATYEECIEFLSEHPEDIYKTWRNPYVTEYGKIFSFLGRERVSDFHETNCGCPTMIKESHQICSEYMFELFAITDEITDEVLNDPLIPTDIDELSGMSFQQRKIVLERFVYYQKKVDDYCGGRP